MASLNLCFGKIAKKSRGRFYFGWTSSRCEQCGESANVLNGPGYFCECGKFNSLAMSPPDAGDGRLDLYINPHYGPTRALITEALAV